MGWYPAKQLKKLKNIYEKGVKAIKKAAVYDKVSVAYYKYKGLLLDIRPSKLEKYKNKYVNELRSLQGKFEKEHCTDEGYWDHGYEGIMNDGVEEIMKAKTKTKFIAGRDSENILHRCFFVLELSRSDLFW